MRIARCVSIAFSSAMALALLAIPADAQPKAKAKRPPQAKNLPAPPAKSVQRPPGASIGFSCPFCDLRGADMAGSNLTDANLQGANLEGANLNNANLIGAELAGANLSNANLEGAKLGRSPKGPTDLSGANLTGAKLRGASLDGTDLQYTDLSRTDQAGVDLSKAVMPKLPAAGSDAPWTCNGADLSRLQTRIYVSTNGTDSESCGTDSGKPCATISTGISRCGGANACGVLVQWGEYKPTATIALTDGVNVYGGCVPSTAVVTGVQSLVNAPTSGRPAISATGISKTETILQGFRLQGSAAQWPFGAASVTLLIANSSKLTIVDTRILANSGAPGQSGGGGRAGAAGVNGSGASGGTQNACSWTAGGSGSVVMGVYLTGNEGSFTCNPTCSANACWGYVGGNGGGPGGQWGNGNCAWCSQSRGATGNGGTGGRDATSCGGKGNASGNIAGSFSGTTWQASIGGTGGAGNAGSGGGGGGAGGYRAGYCFGQRTWEGNQGGGGGSGGCAGGGGVGGQQGGASLGIAVIASSFALTNSALVGGIGGGGGTGGIGGQGGARSSGAGGLGDHGGGYGGSGGGGGAGSAAGGGAGGNGGPAVGMALVTNSRVIDAGTVYYTGASGAVGGFGSGGQPIVAGLCSGANGDTGRPGLAADKQTY